jgi:translation initiation factor IF-2
MATKTTTKSTAAKKPARKPAKIAAAKSSSRPRTTSKTAASKSKPGTTEEQGAPAAGDGAGAMAKSPVTQPNSTAKPSEPPRAVTKSAFTPITGKRPAPRPAAGGTEPQASKQAAPEATVSKPPVESVSLIEPHTPKPKRAPSEEIKRTILPPISRIRSTSALAPEPPKAEPPPALAPAPVGEGEEVVETEDGRKIIHIKPPIIVKDLATQLGLKNFQLIKELMDAYNIFANPNLTVEPEVAAKICENHGFVFEVERREKGAGVHKQVEVVAPPPPPVIEKEEELKLRAPVITFMGHVDHGKTSLMDAIRKTRVAASEAGGITQHIGAYTVDHKGTKITFLDTPGHAAFTAMRARGANVTDIVVLVVAADDGLMPQTIEAINHAKAAEHVKIMVAINKIDLPSANIDRVKQQLQDHGLVPEDWGGETITVPTSATKGTGIDDLLENMVVQAEVMELKASPTATPRGVVIEAQVEPGRGPTATVIVQMGTLKVGEPFICGDYAGKVKSLIDDQGKPIKSAGPSTPVKVLGFTGLPAAGDEFLVMESEKSAKLLSEERIAAKRTEKLSVPQRATLESLLQAENGTKVLRLVLKCDTQGSLEAIATSLGQIDSRKVDLEIIHSGVGPISESDILLASASNAVVVGFNIKVESNAVGAAKREAVQVKLYSIIYELIDQIKEAMAGLLEPEHRETIIGHAEVKQVFQLSRGIVAGCLVTDGRIGRTARARVLRRRQPVYDGGISTLRRFQDDVKEVRSGLECGIKLGDFSEYQVGDVIECYQLEQVPQKL